MIARPIIDNRHRHHRRSAGLPRHDPATTGGRCGGAPKDQCPPGTSRSAAPTSASGTLTCPTAISARPSPLRERVGAARPQGLPGRREGRSDERTRTTARVEEAMHGYWPAKPPDFETEGRIRHKDGPTARCSPGGAVCDVAGKPIRIVGITLDITRLKLAEEAVRASEALPPLVQDSSDIISLFDAEARSSTSPRRSNACSATGWRTGSAGTSSATRSSTRQPGGQVGVLRDGPARPGAPVTAEFRLRTPTARGGTSRPSARTSVRTERRGIVANYRDVTDRKG